jgi:2-(1,2-epoxy-1,2-dihydrophenyl)acetyl-CoA isomerase
MTTGLNGLTLAEYIRKCNASIQGSLARLQHMAAPSLAVVQGVAAGGGVSLLASCDIVVASDKARFVAAYAGIGYCPDMGGTTMLTRRVGVSRARRFYLLHEQLDAAGAEAIGLADMVVPAERLAEAAEQVLDLWANGPTAAYAEIRRLMRSAATTPYESQMELETQSLARLTRTRDAGEALEAFLAKRPARFSGR